MTEGRGTPSDSSFTPFRSPVCRQAAVSEPHDPRFNYLMFLHVVEDITTMGAALSDAAYHHVEKLASLKIKRAR